MSQQNLAIAVSFIIVFAVIMILASYIKVLDDRLSNVSHEVRVLAQKLKPPPANSGAWYPDPSNLPPQPGFVTQDASHQPPPPNFGFPPIDHNQFRAQGQTSPIDNQLPLRGTAK